MIVINQMIIQEFQYGNLTSQYFANIYLNELDYFVKHTLKNNAYVRYMDDFILLTYTKEHAKYLKEQINKFVNQHLHLELNSKSQYYPSVMGVNFCGYRIFSTHRLLRTNSKKKIKKKVKKWNKMFDEGTLNLKAAMQSLNSQRGHISHCNSFTLEKKVLNSCEFLYREQGTFLKIPASRDLGTLLE